MKTRTIFKTYNAMSLKEIEEEEKAAREWLEELRQEDGDDTPVTDEEVTQEVYNREEMYYDDEKCNLNIATEGRIVAIASLGLWDGRRQGYKVLGNNVNEVITSFGCDDVAITYDKYNVYSACYHHDGTNYITFRELREDRNVDRFLDKVYSGEDISRSCLNYYTKGIAHYVTDVYGW